MRPRAEDRLLRRCAGVRASAVAAAAATVVGACAALSVPPAFAHLGVDAQLVEMDARIAEAPADADLRLRRGELHRIHRDWPAAEADLLAARRLDPALETVDFALGLLYLDSDRPKEALAPLGRFLTAHPDHVRARLTRARAEIALDRRRDAIADLDAAVAASARAEGDPSPLMPEVFLERARCLVALDPPDHARALAGLDEGIERLGGAIALQLEALDLELERQAWDAALARVDRLAAGAPRKEAWWIRRGEILVAAGRDAEALEAFRRALDAIDALPNPRKRNRAVRDLRDQARDGVARLSPEQRP